jgi:uncharacterized protein with PQ loop repeat
VWLSEEVSVEGALASLATVMSGAFLVPQLLRLRRTLDGGGVSATAAAVGLVSTLGWAVYGVGTTTAALVPPSVIGAVQYASLLVLLRRAGATIGPGVMVALVWCVFLAASAAAAAATGHELWSGLGTSLAIAVVVQYAPAVVDAWRSDSADGISEPTWLLVGLTGVIWIAYGMLVDDAAVAAYGAVLATAAGAVLAAVRRSVHGSTSTSAVS